MLDEQPPPGTLAYRVFRHAGLAAIGGFAKVKSRRAILGVTLQLMRDMGRRCALDVMAMHFDRARAVGATELSVCVDDCFRDGFELPERLIAAADFDASAFDLALIDLFGFGRHGRLLGNGGAVRLA
jgi:hypothetical protein